MTVKEKRITSFDRMRNLCIKNNWYTRGNNFDYSNLLNTMAGRSYEGVTTDDILWAAKDIIEHSADVTLEDLSSVMFEIANNACCTIFEIEAGERKETMTRSERLAKEGKTDTMYYGVLPIEDEDRIMRSDCYMYEGTDYEYNVDIYVNVLDGHCVALK